jgi:diguanylate cyclase (GGDEF)-like protein
MRRAKILIVDDDPDILDVLALTLNAENYDVIQATNGEEGLALVQSKSPDLVILDYKMPRMDGKQVCQKLKQDLLLQHLPIIMLTGKGEVVDKVNGIDAGADDYIVKPFEPQELLARIRMILRRTERDLDANPLTRLPGNVSILNELQRCIDKKEPFAVGYVDIDHFKSFNDKYGFEHGDEIIKQTARILIKNIKEKGNLDDFIGHIGGDDFVFISTPNKIDELCKAIIQDFDAAIPNLYNDDDKKKGYIIAKNRQGENQKFPIVSISIGVVTNESREISHMAEIGEIGAELKSHAKATRGSNYVKDKRKESQ